MADIINLPPLTHDGLKMYTRAVSVAAAAHARVKQFRADGETPYINHPIRVARNVSMAMGPTDDHYAEILCAAVLHDTIEDTEYMAKDMLEEFGPFITRTVLEVTSDKKLSSGEQKRAQIEKMPKLSHGAQLIKMADKLDNCLDSIRTATDWSIEKIQGYVLQSKRLFDLAPETPAKHILYAQFKLDVLSARVKQDGRIGPVFPITRTEEQQAAHLEAFLQGKFNNEKKKEERTILTVGGMALKHDPMAEILGCRNIVHPRGYLRNWNVAEDRAVSTFTVVQFCRGLFAGDIEWRYFWPINPDQPKEDWFVGFVENAGEDLSKVKVGEVLRIDAEYFKVAAIPALCVVKLERIAEDDAHIK